MDLVALTEFLVKGIVKQPDMVSAKQFDNTEEVIIIEVLVAKDDMGSVIGRKGINANAIRTIVQVASYAQENKPVRINIDSF